MNISKKDFFFGLILVVMFLFFDGCNQIKKHLGTAIISSEKTTTTEYITKKQLDSIADYIISNQKSIPQKIIIREGVVKPVQDNYELSKEEKAQGNKLKQVQKYVDTTKLGNGTIYSEIYADSLFAKKFSLATTDTIVSKTTLEKKVIVKSDFFYGLGSTIGLDGRVKDIEATINYTHKNRFYIEGGFQYDVDPLIQLSPIQKAGIKLKVGFNF